MDWPILSILTFLPLIGAAFILFLVRGDDALAARNARFMALWTSLLVFVCSLYVWFGFDRDFAGFQFVEQVVWITRPEISWHVGVDGISVLFVLLSTLLTPLCILASWKAITHRVKDYMIAFLVLETTMIGTFIALDLVVFYIFFEAVLIPMFILIGVWGSGQRRIYAAFKFFLYTLAGSVLMLLALITIIVVTGTSNIPDLLVSDIPPDLQNWLWWALFASFAVKIPMWPVHTWLPDAHVEAPTAGSVILAGILLKMGGYGFLRFSIPMLPLATAEFANIIFWLSAIAVIYTSLVALMQKDMKKLIAYSSIAHMGFVTLGCFALTTQGVQGGVFQMVSHGVVSAALFLCVGNLYDRYHTREIAAYGGLAKTMPRYAVFFMIFMLASIGLPGTGGFVGEFLVLIGSFPVAQLATILVASGLVLGAAYMLYLYRRVVFGLAPEEKVAELPDLTAREIGIYLPLVALVFWMGVYPTSFTDIMDDSIENLLDRYHTVIDNASDGERIDGPDGNGWSWAPIGIAAGQEDVAIFVGSTPVTTAW